MIPRIGKVNYQTGGYLSYKMAPKDDDGWVEADKYLPMDYHLSDLLTQGSSDSVKGWMNVSKWEGLRLKPDDVVTHWKPAEFHEIRDKTHTKRK